MSSTAQKQLELINKYSYTFYEFLFSNDTKELKEDDDVYIYLDIIKKSNKKYHSPYEIITKMVFDSKNQIDSNSVREKIDLLKADNNVVNQFLDDTCRHIMLSIEQKAYIDNMVKETKRNLDDSTAQLESISKIKDKIYSDYIGILGIFTAITFATFGGLQLLGNVFGKIKDADSTSVGSELMLGSVFLFGTYMILLALLTGISKLMGKNYNTSFPTRFIIVFSFLVIFVFGFVYAKVGYNAKVWSSWINDWTISAIFILSVGVIGLVIDLCYRKNAMIRIKRFVGLRTRYRRCKARHKAKKQLKKPNPQL